MDKRASNKKENESILTNDYMDLMGLCRINNYDQTIIKYIIVHQEQTLEYIGRCDCLAYYRIYKLWFEEVREIKKLFISTN